jgi:hypothetical protein
MSSPFPQAAPTDPPPDSSHELDEHEQLVAWEFLMCLEMGFSVEQSMAMLGVQHFTWHDAQDLIRAHPSWPLATIVDELT